MKASKKLVIAIATAVCTVVLSGGAASALPLLANQWP